MHGFFILLTKLKLKTCVLLKTSSGITALKTSFISNLSISFCPDTESQASAFWLINESSLSYTILTYSGCILGCPWLCSAGYKGAKSIDRGACIVTAGIGITCTIDTCIDSTYAMNTWIGYTNVKGTYTRGISAKSAFVKDVELKILAGLGVNDYCL